MTSMMNASVLNVTRNVTKIGISAHGVIMTFIMTVVGMMNASVLNVITNVTKIVISAHGVIMISIMNVSVINVIMTAVDIIVVKRPTGRFNNAKK
jgi:hypothetical protein